MGKSVNEVKYDMITKEGNSLHTAVVRPVMVPSAAVIKADTVEVPSHPVPLLSFKQPIYFLASLHRHDQSESFPSH